MRAWRLVPGLLVVASWSWAQGVFFGVGAGAVWEKEAPVAPEKIWFHAHRAAESFMVALPVEDSTLVRIEKVDLPHDVLWQGSTREARLAGWTAGVDYFLPGVWGQAVFSTGVGSYRLDLAGNNPPPGVEDTRFGWYAKIGEWFLVTKKLQFAAEVAYHRTNHRGQPQLLVASGSLVFKL